MLRSTIRNRSLASSCWSWGLRRVMRYSFDVKREQTKYRHQVRVCQSIVWSLHLPGLILSQRYVVLNPYQRPSAGDLHTNEACQYCKLSTTISFAPMGSGGRRRGEREDGILGPASGLLKM
jgi:hypothetical protein